MIDNPVFLAKEHLAEHLRLMGGTRAQGNKNILANEYFHKINFYQNYEIIAIFEFDYQVYLILTIMAQSEDHRSKNQ